MPKIVTSFINGCYVPKFLSSQEAEEYERVGFKTCEISQEIIDNWKRYQKETKEWNQYWMKIDSELWEE